MPGCPSWSKGSDLRSAVFVLVGSNPTSGIYLIIQYVIVLYIFTSNIFFNKFFFLKPDKQSI